MNFTEDKYSAPRTIEKMKILGAVWSYQLNRTANPAHLEGDAQNLPLG